MGQSSRSKRAGTCRRSHKGTAPRFCSIECSKLEWAAWWVAWPGQEYSGEGVELMVVVVGDQLGWW